MAPRFFILLALLPLTVGCSTLKVRIDPKGKDSLAAQQRAVLASPAGSSEAGQLLAAATKKDDLAKAIEAARISLPAASRGDADSLAVYNAAVGEVVALMQARGFDSKEIRLDTRRKGSLDPRLAEKLIPAADVRIGGLLSRSTQPGLGVPMAARFKEDSAFLKNEATVPKIGIVLPVTALVTFEGGQAQLTFFQTMVTDHLTVRGKKVQLAADFSAPLAVLLSLGKNRSIDIEALIQTKARFEDARLFQIQPYDPKKIPVVFVHGLVSRPEAWTQAFNGLMADPEVRKRYQFWFLIYPTGLPVWTSAAVLRSELDRFRKTFDPEHKNPNLDRIVLVGHSMGGLISSLMIREGGPKLWHQFSDKSPEELKISDTMKNRIRQLIFFGPRKDVSRVIFVATPHRGSKLALRPIAGFFAKLIRLPLSSSPQEWITIRQAMREDMRAVFVAPANSIQFLKADSPLLTSILRLPVTKKVPYHSIIGDRGKGNSPNSTDGVVPYWSSHLDGAVSEKIVPSGHGANENAQGIEEMKRILLQYGRN